MLNAKRLMPTFGFSVANSRSDDVLGVFLRAAKRLTKNEFNFFNYHGLTSVEL